MTFLVRQISRSAEGREIIRPSEVEGDRLTIGRDPNNDIHLTDLAVALFHATLQRTGLSRLSVSAEEGLGVELNGRKVTAGAIELASGGELRIGTHLVRVMPMGAGETQIAVDVEKVGEGNEEALDVGDVGRFSLSAALPSRRIMAYGFIAIVLGLFLAWPIWVYNQRADARQVGGYAADRMWSSGSLSQVHHDLEGNCSACHVRAFEPVQDAACLTCHTGIDHGGIHRDTIRFPEAADNREEAQARMTRATPNLTGFARFQLSVAEMFGQSAGRCVECHTEHEGPQEMPLTAQRFCSDCHADLDTRLPDTRLANASDFGRHDTQRHPEFQPLVLINWNGEQPVMARVPLDQNPRENSNLKFPHALHLNPTGGVTQMVRRQGDRFDGRQQLACADCHTVTPDGVGFQQIDMEQDCGGACHSLSFDQADGVFRTLRHGSPEQVVADLREYYRGRGPARPAELGPVARRRPGDINQLRMALQFARAQAGTNTAAAQAIARVFQPGGACYDCHVIDQRGPLNFQVRPVVFPTRYLLHGWFDHRAHVQVNLPGQRTQSGDQACLACHNATQSNQAANLMIPDLASCQRCHGGEGSDSAVPSGCAMCHDYHMDDGVPAMLLRQQVRGQRWETTTIPVTGSNMRR